MFKRICALLAPTLLAVSAAAPAFAADPSGTWVTEQDKAQIEITRCGQAFCGTTAAGDLITGSTARGKPVKIQVLRQMVSDGPNRWKGAAFNPEDGNTYEAYMTLASRKELIVKGCAFGFCQEEKWSRLR